MGTLHGKPVLSVAELGTENLLSLVDRALMLAHEDHGNKPTLTGKVVGIYFRCSSTRTRTAFSVGAMKLGAEIICYGPSELQLVTGKPLRIQHACGLNYLNALVIRTNESIL